MESPIKDWTIHIYIFFREERFIFYVSIPIIWYNLANVSTLNIDRKHHTTCLQTYKHKLQLVSTLKEK